VLDAFLEAQKKGKVRHIGFTGHGSYKAHLKMLEELKKRGVKMAASQMPVNPADPHYESFVTHVVPRCVEAGIGVLAMKTLAYGRFFGGNKGWRRTEVSVKPAIPAVLSVEDVFGFVWSLPITSLVSGMESVQQVSQNAAIALHAKHGIGTRPNARNASTRWPPSPARISSFTRAEFLPRGKELQPGFASLADWGS
jgi:predicted aldo/keto reductase-like oxidoreductase